MNIEFKSVNKTFESSFRENWSRPALSNYNGITLYYKDVARRIEELHLMFSQCGLKRGDKVSICGKNQANWTVAFLAVLTYGAVPVPLLHEFKAANVHTLVNHSESRILFVDDQVWETLSIEEMPGLVAVIQINALKLLVSKNEGIDYAAEHIRELMDAEYPGGFDAGSINYYEDSADELALINYTSGTSGFSKGVMLPYRSLASNIDFAAIYHEQMNNQANQVAILPSAHMYGLMFETLYQLSRGVHIHYLTRVPSPKIILQAMGEIKPELVVAVPLVIEKIYKNLLQPEMAKARIRTMCKCVPFARKMIMSVMRKKLIEAFGGRFREVIIGGAAFNKEVEAFFHEMKFPFTVGYGMTECGPIISYSPWYKAKVGSAGYAAPNMEIKIDSPDPAHVSGEILCRGANVFLGYYHNEEATAATFTEDGWFRTGDVGVIDEDGYLFIRGRSKCMILTSNGQNIYPEELESALNNIPYVVETLVVDDKGALVAIVFPDFRAAEKDGIGSDELQKQIEKQIFAANKDFPAYANIKKVEFLSNDFERTPKKSIKRYLYQK